MYSFYHNCLPKELDLTWHIKEYRITDFGCGTLESFVAIWMTTNTYEAKRPAWQIALIHLKDPATGLLETCIIIKISHALADGTSVAVLVGNLTGNHVDVPYIIRDRCLTWRNKALVVLFLSNCKAIIY